MKYGIIGDIHSQSRQLNRALEYCCKNDLTPILLGDIFDSRTSFSDSMGVYIAVTCYPGLILIQSNHQDKLLRYCKHLIKGSVNSMTIGPDLQRTIDELLPRISPEELIEFLEPLPYTVSIDRWYRLAHAYHPYLTKKEYVAGLDRAYRDDLTKTERFLCLYGKKSPEGERVRWWESTPPTRAWIRVAGHYHVHHHSAFNMVLDGSCGDDNGVLVVYNTDKMQTVKFE